MNGASDSSDQWLLTLQHSPIGMTMVGLDGRLLMVNRAMCEMLHCDAETLTQRGFQEITHPDDLDADMALFESTLAGERDSYRIRKRYLQADGTVVWGDLSVALVRGEGGTPLHFISQILDITEQREHEERLKAATAAAEREHRALEAIFETVNVGLLVIGPDGHYERMNQRHEETMRLPFPDGHSGEAGQLGPVFFLDGKTLFAKEDMPSHRAMCGEEFTDYTYWVGDDPLTRRAFSTSARQMRRPDGERLGAALAYQDITDLMHAIRVKDEFVSSVSHELRTPLTSVLGHLEILEDHDDLPADVTRQLLVVRRNAQRLQALLSDLLHVGQIGEGNLLLQRTDVELGVLVAEAVEAARPSAATLDVSVEYEAPAQVHALVDEQRIRQVLDNLISNALKYTNAGGTVRVVLHQAQDTIEVEVSDTGIGIAPEEIEHVFSRFFRGSAALEQHISGTGLGLNIVNSIVAAHDGTITVESEAGKGSIFRISLPSPNI